METSLGELYSFSKNVLNTMFQALFLVLEIQRASKCWELGIQRCLPRWRLPASEKNLVTWRG